MGGLVTRYALAKMEHEGDADAEEVALYWSYDSPHRGAWIPVAVQAFAHYIRASDDRFSEYINSAAAQQLLRWHIATSDAKPEISEKRQDFLEELKKVGWWPQKPRKIGVGNGLGNGQGNGYEPGALALEGKGLNITGTKLKVQSAGNNQLVAELRVAPRLVKTEVRTSEIFTTMDSAPGGTLDSFGIVADALNTLTKNNPVLALRSEAHIRWHCFVPSVSAVAIRDVDTEDDLYTNIDRLDPSESELDEFRLVRPEDEEPENQEHTLMTEELCSWILERLP
ncbi:MAG: hypothetical protein JO110_24485 [Acetobacteraceae bacterium]|nr:hypothetical protein [Acetobacteraceae bacterium]